MLLGHRTCTAACAAFALSFAVGCTGGSGGAQSPDGEAIGASHGGDDASEHSDTLPRYYTIEVRADGLWLDGQLVSSDRVGQLLSDAANDGRNRGAAVILYTDDPPANVVLDQIARAGFTHVVVSGLSSNSFASGASRGAPVAEQVGESPSASAPEPEPQAEADEAPADDAGAADVLVKHYGLHIGGGPNTDEARARYLEPISKQFGKLRECHLLAENRDVQASFGVDLLVGSKGGRAKIQDYRTRLKGKDFQMCVLGALGAVKFPAPERATVVSYSVLFKPQK